MKMEKATKTVARNLVQELESTSVEEVRKRSRRDDPQIDDREESEDELPGCEEEHKEFAMTAQGRLCGQQS